MGEVNIDPSDNTRINAFKTMTTAAQDLMVQTKPFVENGRLKAFHDRQQDSGWGRAWAHLIPCYNIFYAVKRRTITPLYCTIIGGTIVVLTAGVGIAATDPSISNRDLKHSMTVAGLIATPFLAKAGIDLAREQGQRMLIKANDSLVDIAYRDFSPQ